MKEIVKKLGILGGGQLGKMLCMAGAPWHLDVSVLDKSKTFPAGPYCRNFVEGDFSVFEDVWQFGKEMDIITIEIEGVNSRALHELKAMGKEVYPDPEFLDVIKDKGAQNAFFQKLELPIPQFESFDSKEYFVAALTEGRWKMPLIWKSRFEGYDGRGVKLIKVKEDLNELPESPCIAEELVEIDKELAMIIARNSEGEVARYQPVEMVFKPKANLLDQLRFPADISGELEEEMGQIAQRIVESASYTGILAIEFFLDSKSRLLVNEVAPRPHNSGHHTIECCITSQYEQLLRAVYNLPLGDTLGIQRGIMFNLLGEADCKGPAVLNGMEAIMGTSNAHLQWYGKRETRPFRKMGHVVVGGNDLDQLQNTVRDLKNKLKVKT